MSFDCGQCSRSIDLVPEGFLSFTSQLDLGPADRLWEESGKSAGVGMCGRREFASPGPKNNAVLSILQDACQELAFKSSCAQAPNQARKGMKQSQTCRVLGWRKP